MNSYGFCGPNYFREYGMRFRRHHFGGPRSAWMFGVGGRFFGPGEVRLALLSLLGDGPRHGYELMKLLEKRSGGVYRASAGTIYPTLQQLEDEGLITSEASEGKRVYRITDTGRQELDRESEAVRRIWRRAENLNDWRSAFDPDSAEIRGPAERLIKAAFRAVSGDRGAQETLEKVRDILVRALRDIENL